MKSRKVPMSIEEFHLLPFNPAWKQECWGGHLHLTPRHVCVDTVVQVAPRVVESTSLFRLPTPAEAEELAACFFRAFEDTIEYCDWPIEKVRESADQCIEEYFSGKRGGPSPASRLALNHDRTGSGTGIAGAALVIHPRPGTARLDVLFIDPRRRRTGLATALVAEAITTLDAAGIAQLQSTYMLGNEPSERWHHKFGFEDVPSLRLARLHLRAAQQEIRRLQAGKVDPVQASALESEVLRWEEQVGKLEREDLPDSL